MLGLYQPSAPLWSRKTASLPTARNWVDWLHYHAPKLDTSQGWVRFITDATMLLQQMHVGIGMVLRKMDLQSNAWHPDEFAPITQSTRRSLKWFEDNKPKDADCPPWASFLLT